MLFRAVRFNALSRPIEEVFRRHGIPCVILGGHKFFDRAEVRLRRPRCLYLYVF